MTPNYFRRNCALSFRRRSRNYGPNPKLQKPVDGSEENVILEGLQVKAAALQGEFKDFKQLNIYQQAFLSPEVVVMCCPKKDEHGGDSLHNFLEIMDRMI